MNASAPIPEQRPNEDRATEPSMEEILASIRRIIADDQVLPLTPRSAPEPPKPHGAPAAAAPSVTPPPRYEAPPGGVIVAHGVVLTTGRRLPVQPALVRLPVAGRGTRRWRARRGAEVAIARRCDGRRRFDTAESTGLEASLAARLRSAIERPRDESPASTTASSAPAPREVAFTEPGAEPAGKLLSAAAQASVASSFQALAATTSHEMIDSTVRDMLRPMLKQWLDDNLPALVERLVRAEIERVARGGR